MGAVEPESGAVSSPDGIRGGSYLEAGGFSGALVSGFSCERNGVGRPAPPPGKSAVGVAPFARAV